MLPVPVAAAGGAAAWSQLAPAKAQWLASTTLPKYRELLRQARARQASEEESGSLFQQARERVLLRLRERRRGGAPRVDPRRAFSRLQERMAETRLSLRALKNEHKQRLQAYYRSALAGSATNASSSSSASAVAEAAQQPLAVLPSAALEAEGLSAAEAERAAAALGTDGVLRVRWVAGWGWGSSLLIRCEWLHAHLQQVHRLTHCRPPTSCAARGAGGRGQRLQAVPGCGGAHDGGGRRAHGCGAGARARARPGDCEQPCGLGGRPAHHLGQ